MTAFDSTSHEKLLDSVGWAILKELQADARISYSELGKRIGMSSPAIAERVRRMEDAGIIRGYRAEIDLSGVGYSISAILRIQSFNGQTSQIHELAATMPEVRDCFEVTGDDCYVIRVAVASVEHLESLIRQFSTYSQVITSLILSTPIRNRPVEPRGD